MEVAGSLSIVADGVGGGTAGGRASKYAVECVLHDYYHHESEDIEERLRDAFRNANRGVFDFANDMSSGKGVGTTLVAAITFGERLVIGNVGDSRAYRLRGNQVTQLTKDHSLVQQLLDAGELSPEEASTFPKRNVLTRCIGAEKRVHPDFFDHVLEEGDILILCSDGFHNYLETSQELDTLIDRDLPAQGIAEKLVELANRRGGADNITALVIRVLHPSQAAGLPEDELATMIPGRLRAPSPLDGARSSAGRKYNKRPILLTTVAIVGAVGLVAGYAALRGNAPDLTEGSRGSPAVIPVATSSGEATAAVAVSIDATVVPPTETVVPPAESGPSAPGGACLHPNMWTDCGGMVGNTQEVYCSDTQVGYCHEKLTWECIPDPGKCVSTDVSPTEIPTRPPTNIPVIADPTANATVAASSEASENVSTEPNCLYNVKETDNLPWIAADALGLPRGTKESGKVGPKVMEIMDDNDLSDDIIKAGQQLILFWQNEDHTLTEEGAGNVDGELPECPKVSQ